MNKLAKEMTEYIELTSAVIDEQSARIGQLEKQAGVEPVLNKEAVDAAVDTLVQAGFEQPGNRDALSARLQADPAQVLVCLQKVAAARKPKAGAMPTMGKVASEVEFGSAEGEGPRESDKAFEAHFTGARR